METAAHGDRPDESPVDIESAVQNREVAPGWSEDLGATLAGSAC
jgi:hypothetical protein